MKRGIFIALVCLLVPQLAPASKSVGSRFVSGWLESIILMPWGIKLRAKLDTGAKTSSIHARGIEKFERDGESWVRFETFNTRGKGEKKIPIEKRLLRTVRIRQHNLPEMERLVVRLAFCFNARIFESEFTLVDRGKFFYPVLLGRRLLTQGILVDPSSTFTIKTRRKYCPSLIEGDRGKRSPGIAPRIDR